MRQRGLSIPIVLITILVFVAAVAGGYLYSQRQSLGLTETPTSNIPTPPPGAPTPAPGPEITEPNFVDVRDQEAGRAIAVHAVSFVKSGYIYIHLTDEEGQAGQVIGQSQLIEGTKVDLTITLTQATQSGQVLIAMLHDEERKPLVGEDGQIIQREFKITSAAEN